MEALKGIFEFAAETAAHTPEIIGYSALFYLAATTIIEVATTGVPFWSTLTSNATHGVITVLDAGSGLINGVV